MFRFRFVRVLCWVSIFAALALFLAYGLGRWNSSDIFVTVSIGGAVGITLNAMSETNNVLPIIVAWLATGLIAGIAIGNRVFEADTVVVVGSAALGLIVSIALGSVFFNHRAGKRQRGVYLRPVR
jgi:hypothetical protein